MNKKSTAACQLFFLSGLFIAPALISEVKIQRRQAAEKIQLHVLLFSVNELPFIQH